MRTVDPTIPRPTAKANPVSPDNHPTSSTIPMDIDDAAAAGAEDNVADLTMRAESISLGSSSATVSSETTVNIEQLIWTNLVTNECAPMVRYLLDDADFYPIGNMAATDKLKKVNREGQFHPSTMGQQSGATPLVDMADRGHRWNNSFTMVQCQASKKCMATIYIVTTGSAIVLITVSISQYIADGTVGTGQCMPLYGRDKPFTLMVWRQSVAHIRRASMANGIYSSSIYFGQAEDISIEFVPNHNEANANNAGQETAMFKIQFILRGAMGTPIGVWNIEE
eukprot:6490519-Amphidinium_carterae.2